MSQLSGAFTIETDRLAEEIAQRTAVIVVGMLRSAPVGSAEYRREQDPGAQGTGRPWRGVREADVTDNDE